MNYEKNNSLYNEEIYGFKYWEHIRFRVYTDVKIKYYNMSSIFSFSVPKLKNYLIDLKQLTNYLGFCRIYQKDILFISNPRRIYQNGKYENPYIDELEHFITNYYGCATIEEPCYNAFVSSETAHMFPVYTDNIYYTDLYEISYLLKKRLYKTFNKKRYAVIKSEICKLITNIEKEYNVDISYDIDNIVDMILYCLIMKKMYLKLLKKINPKVVVINYFPTSFKTLIINICKDNKIPVVELQHGTITQEDPCEHKCYDNKVCRDVADYFFSFGDLQVNKKYFTTLNSNIKNIGFPFLERKINSTYTLPDQLDYDSKYILIVSQTIIGNELSDFASRLSNQLIKNNLDYKIIFKYHPNEIGRVYKSLNKPNIIVIDKKGEEIYKYQKYSYIQIGVYSTALYEGLAFGLPTFILGSIESSKLTKPLLRKIKKGLFLINDEFDLINILKGDIERPSKKEITKLWKQNSLENFKTEISTIIQKNKL